MKRIFLIPWLLLLAANAPLAQPAKEPAPWKRFAVRGEEFSVMLPPHPAMSTRKAMVMRLSKERQQRMLGAYADGLALPCCVLRTQARESRWTTSSSRKSSHIRVGTVPVNKNSLSMVSKVNNTCRRIIPAMKNGKFVSTWMQLEYNFNLY